MGHLLIKKKGWSSKYEELKLTFVEVQDTLKREQVTYSIAITDVEKRDVNLRKVVGLEKQHMSDGESSIADKGTSRNARMQNRAQTSNITMSEHKGEDSKGLLDCVRVGKQRKRRQKVVSDVQPPVHPPYNLWRPKT
ncbi:hypothetical protein LWI28_006019 [Acer negundo]|uniref:Uncharacterized protein n=1 Tax=Acer negundo TaxID=4023 RepID=A0AAD5ITK3_ACENE|nr:hypothetical protein LWI28_006019 [Acer negundo]